MKKSFIYFLVDADESNARFKLGQSIDPYRRHKSLSQSFNLDKSWQVECLSVSARDLEQEIHAIYSDYRIDPNEFGWVNGKTEWFKIECLNDILEKIRDEKHAHLFGKLCKIERQTHQMVVQVPEYLHRRIRLTKIKNDSSMQEEMLAALEAYFSEEVTLRDMRA
jgi:hypothetical protein